MAGGLDANPPPNRFFQFFWGMGRAVLLSKFLAIGSSLGHLSIKKFLDRTYRLGPKIKQKEGAGGQPPPPPLEPKLTYFSNHEDDIQSQQTLVWSKIVSK